jgi:hypothetical protein
MIDYCKRVVIVVVVFINEQFVDVEILLVRLHLDCHWAGLKASSGFLYKLSSSLF